MHGSDRLADVPQQGRDLPRHGNPPGYPGGMGDPSYGYDALPEYNYADPIHACDPSQAEDPVPRVNLDETDQITLANMDTPEVAAAPGAGDGRTGRQGGPGHHQPAATPWTSAR
jgi:hypothetical protein